MALRTEEGQRSYRVVRRNWEALADFEQPEGLVSFLTAREGDSRAKNRLLAGLVTLVQMGASASFFIALLWMGLWPGLDGVYRRSLRRTERPPIEVVSLLSTSFMDLVTRVNVANGQHVAASLVRGTERDVLKAWRKEQAEQSQAAHLVGLPEADDEWEASVEWPGQLAPPAHSFDSEVQELRTWLRALLGADADLMVSVFIREEDYAAAGASLGLSPETARKRIQRALARLREMKRKIPRKDSCPKSARPKCL